jgi:ribonuclease HI
VFRRVRKSGMKLQKAKCSFGKKEIEFLGHIVTRDGLKIDPSKVEKIKNWKVPTKLKELQMFCGLVNYFRKFVKDHSRIVKPIYDAMKGARIGKFDWTKDCQTAFDLVIKSICEAVTLTYPDIRRPFQVTTDASKGGLGAVLEQIDEEGNVKTIAFASRSLNDAETRYSATELEMLGALWAMQHFRYYLYDEFILYTDHKPLTGIVKYKSDDYGNRMNKWLLKMADFKVKIKYIPGKANKAADALSRMVHDHLKNIVDNIESTTK